MKCENCAYWKSSAGLDMGECRCEAPVFNHDLAELLSDECVNCHQRGWWPVVHKDDFCGCYSSFSSEM